MSSTSSNSFVDITLKPLARLNRLMGSCAFRVKSKWYRMYSVYNLLINSVMLVLITKNTFWDCPDKLVSSRILRCLELIITTSMINLAILRSVWFKNGSIIKLIATLTDIELLLGNKQKKCYVTVYLDIVVAHIFASSYMIYHIWTYEDGCEFVYLISDDFTQLLVIIIFLLPVKILGIINRFFEDTNQLLCSGFKGRSGESNYVLTISKVERLYRKLYHCLALWNDIYGIQLLLFFLCLLVQDIQDVTTIIRSFRRGQHLEWDDYWALQTLVVYQVFSIFLSRIGYQLADKTRQASKIILQILVDSILADKAVYGMVKGKFNLMLQKMNCYQRFASAADYFVLNYNFFLSLLSVIASYIIVILQIE